MNVSFETAELRTMCSSLEAAEHALGSAGAKALLSILSDIEALDSANEFMELAGGDATTPSGNVIEVTVGREHRAILIPVGVSYKTQPDESVDWSTVRYLKLTALAPRP